jgi:hydrogenase maturation protein HypF
VVRVDPGKQSPVYLRRSRGYSPYPVHIPFEVKPTLAVGGELKNTFCLTRDRYAFLSHHIGDMENAEVYQSFEQGVEHLSRLFRIAPEIMAHDLHPNYFTTAYAHRSTLSARRVEVQHHHAHLAACMADNGLDNQRVIGLAFDGTGYGTDGTIWGGEVLIADYAGFERFAHLEYLPLPGGDTAIRKPWRIAAGYADSLGLQISGLPFLNKVDEQELFIVRQQVEKSLYAPLTSSMGRLFDAVAALAGVRTEVTYEAQAAIELETLSRDILSAVKPYPFTMDETGSGLLIRLKDLLAAVVEDVRGKKSAGLIGARFHQTVTAIALQACHQARARTGIKEVALSGGVWQNQLLLDLAREGLEQAGFTVYFHQQTPTNDGGLALGQAVVANFQSPFL